MTRYLNRIINTKQEHPRNAITFAYPRMFLFISHITNPFLVKDMSPDLLPGQSRDRGTEEQTVSDR